MTSRIAIPFGQREAIITGTGCHVPSRVVTNAELSAGLGDDIGPVVSGTLGIAQRHWCGPDESTADLAEEAGRQALEMAGAPPESVDLLIVATDTPEFVLPATASVVQGRLGLVNAATFDLNAGGAGFVTALDVAWKCIRADERYARVLVIGASAISKFLDRHDRKTVTVFADGAGAALLEVAAAGPEPTGVLAAELVADGRHCHGMGIFAGGTRTPITASVLETGIQNRLRIVQPIPPSLAEEGWPRIVRSVLGRVGTTPDAVDWWLWPQMDRNTIAVVMETLGQPMARAHTVMHQWGYTGPACLPMALDAAVRAGLVRDGQLLMCTGSGAGFALGSLALRWRSAGAG